MQNAKLKYYGLAGALGLVWFGVLFVLPWMREVLIGLIVWNALFLVLSSLIVAHIFKRFILSARSLKQDLLRAVVIPYAGCVIFISFLVLVNILGGGNPAESLVLYFWGLIYAMAGFFVIVPFGLFCQYVLRRVAA